MFAVFEKHKLAALTPCLVWCRNRSQAFLLLEFLPHPFLLQTSPDLSWTNQAASYIVCWTAFSLWATPYSQACLVQLTDCSAVADPLQAFDADLNILVLRGLSPNCGVLEVVAF